MHHIEIKVNSFVQKFAHSMLQHMCCKCAIVVNIPKWSPNCYSNWFPKFSGVISTIVQVPHCALESALNVVYHKLNVLIRPDISSNGWKIVISLMEDKLWKLTQLVHISALLNEMILKCNDKIVSCHYQFHILTFECHSQCWHLY